MPEQEILQGKIIAWKNVSETALSLQEQKRLIALEPVFESSNDNSEVKSSAPVYLNKAGSNFNRWCAGVNK